MVEIEQQAFLLHSRPYQDHNYIVDLLTEYDGKVSAVVFIGKNAKANKKAFLQPFRPLTILLKGRGALKNLSRLESSGKSLNLTGNYLYSGFYLNELLIRLMTEQQICPALFQQYRQSLTELAAKKALENNLRNFEITLLDELGISFDFSPLFEQHTVDQTNNEEQSFPPTHYYFSSEQGFVPWLNQGIAESYCCYKVEHLIAIAEQRLDSQEIMLTYKLLMRQVINSLLGSKPLNSRKFFKRGCT